MWSFFDISFSLKHTGHPYQLGPPNATEDDNGACEVPGPAGGDPGSRIADPGSGKNWGRVEKKGGKGPALRAPHLGPPLRAPHLGPPTKKGGKWEREWGLGFGDMGDGDGDGVMGERSREAALVAIEVRSVTTIPE